MAEVVERYMVAASNGRSTAADRPQFGGGWRSLGKPTRKVRAQGLPQQLRASAVFGLSDAFQLREHGWGE